MKKNTPTVDTAPTATPISQGTLENTITTMCTVASASSVDVATSVSAPIKEILAHVGDTVVKDQVLCRLDSTSLETDLTLKQKALTAAQDAYNASVTAAETTLARAQADFSKVYDAQNTALAALNAKKEQLATEDANNAIAATNSGVKDALNTQSIWEERYNKIVSGVTFYGDNWIEVASPEAVPTGETIKTIVDASNAVTDARNAFEAAKASAFPNAYATCYARVAEAHADVIAPLQEAYNAAVKSAETSATLANRSIADAQTALNTTKKATTSVDTAKRDVEEAQKKLTECEVKAPAAGTIVSTKAAINATPVAADALFSISNNSDFKVTGLLNEYDSTRVTVGMRAKVTTDATGEAVMEGTVSLISPQATDASGNFTVTVNITSPEDQLRGGMTGKLRIVLEGADDCFYVAADSIGMDEDGNSVIYVVPAADPSASSTAIKESDAKAIKVETGVVTDYYTQIISDELTADMQVLDTPLM
ncbi:MAG: HlyD family efflux transporter periplasmic adaptor subunit [Ruminococcaceae bacterium]|nr:HlyD family efflux transporter periplasmic adaptor subunit [Oscillospiraceae bacterium]